MGSILRALCTTFLFACFIPLRILGKDKFQELDATFFRNPVERSCVLMREEFVSHNNEDLFVNGQRMGFPCGPMCIIQGSSAALRRNGIVVSQKEILSRLVAFHTDAPPQELTGKTRLTATQLASAAQAVLRDFRIDSFFDVRNVGLWKDTDVLLQGKENQLQFLLVGYYGKTTSKRRLGHFLTVVGRRRISDNAIEVQLLDGDAPRILTLATLTKSQGGVVEFQGSSFQELSRTFGQIYGEDGLRFELEDVVTLNLDFSFLPSRNPHYRFDYWGVNADQLLSDMYILAQTPQGTDKVFAILSGFSELDPSHLQAPAHAETRYVISKTGFYDAAIELRARGLNLIDPSDRQRIRDLADRMMDRGSSR